MKQNGLERIDECTLSWCSLILVGIQVPMIYDIRVQGFSKQLVRLNNCRALIRDFAEEACTLQLICNSLPDMGH